MNKCLICKKPAKVKYCPEHTQHFNNFEGTDYTREIFRQFMNNKCQECKRVWKEGTRRFDVHHLYECGKRSHKYDNLEYLMEYAMLLCHRCHFNHDTHTSQLKANA